MSDVRYRGYCDLVGTGTKDIWLEDEAYEAAALRPVVLLLPGVNLDKLDDGTWKIVQ